jgi:signal-transduction protein with cAMP-binding, CBS, and nucleotidyltransferase domain
MALKPENVAQARMLLKGILLFSGASDPQIDALVTELDMAEYKKSKVVIMEQEISKMLYILATGAVGIWRREGGEKKLVATLRAPDFFGETSMFTESAATALVKAEEDSRVFLLKRASFDAVVAKFPELAPLVQNQIKLIHAARPPIVKPKPAEES